ncbi:hypothetical protein IL306_002965, partial [Fusarium sp. DS 682]
MGIDAGFDMVPRLSSGVDDQQDWDRFIEDVKILYKGDPVFKIHTNYVAFEAGEYPRLPLQGHKLLRFSSKLCRGVDPYLMDVTDLARHHFGSRVRKWMDGVEDSHYSWNEVNDSFKLYDQPDQAPSNSALSTRLFEVRDIPPKGRGLVAKSDISIGTRIICEQPILLAQKMSPDLLEAILAAKLKDLSKAQQRQFLSLRNNHPGKHPFGGIFRTNALPCGSGASTGGIYPTICLINHSCSPNAHNNWNDNAKHETIHAVRPIRAGEEITIS